MSAFKSPYIFINAAGAALLALTFFSESLAAPGAAAFLLMAFAWPVAALILIAVNIAAYRVTDRFRNFAGVVFALLLGGVGTLMAAYGQFKYEKAVKLISLTELWLVVWLALGGALWVFGYYR